jgi:hypothetical protein
MPIHVPLMLVPRVIAPHLRAAPAPLHAAPAPGAIPARVVEEPAAVVGARTLAEPRQVTLREELDGGSDHGPDDQDQGVDLPRPAEAILHSDERGRPKGVDVFGPDRGEVAVQWFGAAGDGSEHSVDDGPESKGALEDKRGRARISDREGEQL